MVSLIALAVSLVALTAAGALAYRHRGRGQLPVGATVIVSTQRPDDQSIHGVVVADNARHVVLGGAHYLEPDGTATRIAAPQVWIERPVAFVQVGADPLPLPSGDAVGEPGRPGAPSLPDNRHLTSVAE